MDYNKMAKGALWIPDHLTLIIQKELNIDYF